MYNDFLQIKSLEGELKLSHKKREFGITLSTKELVYQKPHVNYIIRLDGIVTITPYEPSEARGRRRGWTGVPTHELIGLATGKDHYRIYTTGAVMHSRSGLFTLGATEFILPIAPEMLRAIGKYSGLESF